MYDHLGGNHSDVLKELVATLCTYGLAVLWLGPCPVVLLWAALHCLGLNLELWTAKLFSMEPLASFEVGLGRVVIRSNGIRLCFGYCFELCLCMYIIFCF